MKTSKMTQLFSTAALVATVAVPAVAQEEAGESGVFGVEGLSAAVSMDVVNPYIFRGYEQQDEGLIFQPGASLSLGLTDTEDFSIGAYVGNWASLHSAPGAGATKSPKSFYEYDLYGGVTLEAGYFSVDLGYIGYFYPSDSFDEIHEAVLTVGFDDSEFLGEYAVSPYIMYAQEFDNNNGDELAYLEVGGALPIDLQEEFDLPFLIEIPFAVGMSLDDYYTDAAGDEEFFGYASAGLMASMPMSELIGTEDHIGSWDVYGGVTFYLLNSKAAGLKDSSEGQSFNISGTVGISKEW